MNTELQYLSTRGNHDPVPSAKAITLGMVPGGGLFVPERIPHHPPLPPLGCSYQDLARSVLKCLLTDFSSADIDYCVDHAYTSVTFDTPSVAELVPLDERRYLLELWHGPTAAFKDMALQIMPHFLAVSKRTLGDRTHTAILVATSGDTGKAALEGFKNAPGISIIVFYPHGGVSEIQKLQMVTTDGANTFVIAVKGNFDDCQRGVKKILGDQAFREQYAAQGFSFSSANSINWGRLCPQIVYYFHAYQTMVARGIIHAGERIDICVPTGNFGNILAAYYAYAMGLPVTKLLCASNLNNVLTDFFVSGTYNANRTFHRTMSPSMDILVSSNLERFLFEMTGHNSTKVQDWNRSLAANGVFSVDPAARMRMADLIVSGWVDETEVLATIKKEYEHCGYVLDTHTAVAVALSKRNDSNKRPTVIASTASPYKFSTHVLSGMTGEHVTDEFTAIDRIASLWDVPVHGALAGLRARPTRHSRVIDQDGMETSVREILAGFQR
jgi:threonine synthase